MTHTALIVEDSGFMRNLLREILEGIDVEVMSEATNGVEAIEEYDRHKPDLVMMDIVMPEKNGIEATEAIKAKDAEATVIMCTSVGQREKMKAAVRAGADGYITKPFQEESVVQAIDETLSV